MKLELCKLDFQVSFAIRLAALAARGGAQLRIGFHDTCVAAVREKGYEAPYWQLVKLARTAKEAVEGAK
ncbi:MAG: hypothetical protein R6X27_03895 [Candidatus Desulfacyla sp.]